MKNIRFLHSAALLRPPSGICTQMDWEQEAATELGLNWRVKMFCPQGTRGGFKTMLFDEKTNCHELENKADALKSWLKLRRNYHRWLLNQQSEVDVFLLRYYVHDPFQAYFVRKCKKPVFFVHHTLEVPELALPGKLSSLVRARLESWIGPSTLRKATGIIGVTQEIVDYELSRSGVHEERATVYPNGVLYRDLQLMDCRGKDVPEMLFVANFAPWHGLDRLLLALKDSHHDFVLHLVGQIPEECTQIANDARIKMHGELSSQEIFELSQRCWIGLASFALDRKKMKQACPLKVREYLMLGLPVCGDYTDTIPSGRLFKKVENTDFDEIIMFARESRGMAKEDVSASAKKLIDKKNLLHALVADLVGKDRLGVHPA